MANLANIVTNFLVIIPLVMTATEDDNEEIVGRIVGGRICKIAEVPFMVSLLMIYQYAFFDCGGTLISYDWILTAAHCIFNNIVEDGNMIATVGCEYPLEVFGHIDPKKRPYSQSRIVSYYFKHPKFNHSLNQEFRYDIAVMKTKKPFEPHRLVQPAKLPTKGYSKDCSVGLAAGWGVTIPKSLIINDYEKESIENRRISENKVFPFDYRKPLKCVILPILSFEECIKYFDPKEYGIDYSVLCTLFPGGGKDACQGDSGGPLICDNNTVVGIIKGGMGCGRPGTPAGSTNVEAYLDWIANAQKMPKAAVESTTTSTVATEKRDEKKREEKKSNGSCINVSVILVLVNCIILFYKQAV